VVVVVLVVQLRLQEITVVVVEEQLLNILLVAEVEPQKLEGIHNTLVSREPHSKEEKVFKEALEDVRIVLELLAMAVLELLVTVVAAVAVVLIHIQPRQVMVLAHQEEEIPHPLLQNQELQTLAVAVVVESLVRARVAQAAQATHELPTGHKERFYGTTLCFY
jgi:hypothetical protein